MGVTHCPELDPKLYSVILEKALANLGLPVNYSLVGGGTCGNAYLSNGRIYKITTDKSEAVESNKLIGKNNNHIANVLNVKKVNTTLTDEEVFLIVLEQLDTSKKNIFAEIENNLDEIFTHNFNQDLYNIINLYANKNTTYRNVIEPKLKQLLAPRQREKLYYESLLRIIDELKQNRIHSMDVHFNNLGVKKNGNLAFFDLGFSDDTDAHLSSIDIGEQIVERVMSYMKGASAMNVKKKCQLGGLGNGKSAACNQGDISNIELKPIKEGVDDLAYKKWKRDNVTYRGVSADAGADGINGGSDVLGKGLYSAPASNKTMARQYGKLAMLVNARPKNPKIFNTLNEWEIWFQNNLVFPLSKAKGKTYPDIRDFNAVTDIATEMTKLGYDGVIIKGREMVNYKPTDVRYYYNERQLEMYYDDFVVNQSISEHTSKWKAKKEKIEQIVEFEMMDLLDEGITAYHGTPNTFDKFSTDKIGSSDGREVGGWGLYFTTDYNVANDYAGNGGVMEVELRNGDYLDLDEAMDDNLANDIIRNGLRKGLSEDDIQQFESDFMDEQYRYDTTNKQVYEWLAAILGSNKAASMYLKQAGYLGNIFNDKTNPDAKNYVIFDANSVKIINSGNGQEELYETDQNPSGFDLKIFDSLKSFAARKKYADERLQKIGVGSSRIVYDLKDGTVLKLASNKKGLDQNREECGLGQDNYFSTIVAKVSNCHNDDLWIVSEFANKISPKRFKELTGVDINNVNYYLRNMEQDHSGQKPIFHIPQEIEAELHENEFLQQLAELMNSYDLAAGDLGKINSYGEVNRNGSPDVVLSDYGLSKDVYNTHYTGGNKDRYIREDYFGMGEAVKIGINDLPFKSDVEQAGGKIYSVGGAVRDNILGKESKDLDLLITGIPLDQLEQILHKYGKVDNVGKSFGIIKFNTPETGELDIAIPRTERKNAAGGYQGFDVTSDHTLPIEKDLERRDFTINAIAKDASGLVIDPYGGQGDIAKKQIKMVNPQAFKDDPLRMLRAVQFAARFNFAIEPETMKAIQQNAAKIREISPERILIEFDKIVKKGNPLVGAKLLRQSGLYDQIFGVSRGINLADFNQVKTMGEFVYELIKGAVKNPADFYKNNLKGDLDTYNEIKALQIGSQFNGDKKTIFDMYKTYPKSLETGVFGKNFTDSVNYMKAHNIPFSLKEVPVNGNDLMEMGYAGKQIGDVFVNILNKLYKEELPNNREDILNYVKSLK